ncbi:unnamed protein product [Xylocopa violacea]|uniref:Uncharacterized protein n=1 Tax=Xylocopa violacea TaxID=135666 RepID=A0ABP1NH57_XYLVO
MVNPAIYSTGENSTNVQMSENNFVLSIRFLSDNALTYSTSIQVVILFPRDLRIPINVAYSLSIVFSQRTAEKHREEHRRGTKEGGKQIRKRHRLTQFHWWLQDRSRKKFMILSTVAVVPVVQLPKTFVSSMTGVQGNFTHLLVLPTDRPMRIPASYILPRVSMDVKKK